MRVGSVSRACLILADGLVFGNWLRCLSCAVLQHRPGFIGLEGLLFISSTFWELSILGSAGNGLACESHGSGCLTRPFRVGGAWSHVEHSFLSHYISCGTIASWVLQDDTQVTDEDRD